MKKYYILLFVFVIIIVLSLIILFLTIDYKREQKINDPLYCEKDSDCTFQYTEATCRLCNCPRPINIYNVKEFNCSNSTDFCDMYCPPSTLKCIQNKCTEVITPTDKESCEARGGEWRIWNDYPDAAPECNLPTSDAGKRCSDSSQCESYCQAPEGAEIGAKVVGECYKFMIVPCMQEVRNGVVDAEWCY
ncbi:hypothetical protein HYT51_02150 [Candidatus Woesearchaeota archaeon]|nr:hypothetical protein [Candidatus Woesearchaeota archaeon]